MKKIFFDAGQTLFNMFPVPKKGLFEYFCSKLADINLSEYDLEKGAIASEIFFQESCVGTEHFETKSFWEKYYLIGLEHSGVSYEIASELSIDITSRIGEIKQKYELTDGIMNVLFELKRRGYKLGVISNWDGTLEHILNELDILHYFDYVADSGLLGIEKPNVEIFKVALKELGCTPQDSIYIGDLYYFDVCPARDIGMEAILYDSVDALGNVCKSNRITGMEQLLQYID